MRKRLAILAVTIAVLGGSFFVRAQNAPQTPQPQQPQYRVHVTSELVLVNVVVRDNKGNLVRDLKKDDFTLLEDGKRQTISSFDFENVDELKTAGAAETTVSGTAPDGALLRPAEKTAALNARDRRLMLLFFDFSGMDPEQIDRSVDAAKKFVQTRMQPADLIALVSLATNMRVDLDFTDDKTKVLGALTSYTSGQGQASTTAPPAAPKAPPKPAARSPPTTPTTTPSTQTASCSRCKPSCRRSAKYRRRKPSFISAMASARTGWTTNRLCAPRLLPRRKPTSQSIP